MYLWSHLRPLFLFFPLLIQQLFSGYLFSNMYHPRSEEGNKAIKNICPVEFTQGTAGKDREHEGPGQPPVPG